MTAIPRDPCVTSFFQVPSPEFPLIRNEAVELVRGPLHGWFPLRSLCFSTFPYRETERKRGTAAAEEARKMEPASPKKMGGRARGEPPKRGRSRQSVRRPGGLCKKMYGLPEVPTYLILRHVQTPKSYSDMRPSRKKCRYFGKSLHLFA